MRQQHWQRKSTLGASFRPTLGGVIEKSLKGRARDEPEESYALGAWKDNEKREKQYLGDFSDVLFGREGGDLFSGCVAVANGVLGQLGNAVEIELVHNLLSVGIDGFHAEA